VSPSRNTAATPEPFRARGEWWLPATPGSKVAGDLEVEHHESPRLDLSRFIGDGHPDARHDAVLGTTLAGLPMTLEALWQIERPLVYSNRLPEPIQREVLTAEWGYRGAHLETPAERTFSSATIELSDLLVWSGTTGITEELLPKLAGVTITVRRPDDLVVELPAGRLTLGHRWATSGDGRRSRGIGASALFAVDVAEPLHAQAILATFGDPLRYLLTFATDRPNEIEQLVGLTDKYGAMPRTEVEIDYGRVGDRRTLADSIGHDYLFDALSLGDRYPAVITRWFELYDRVRSAIHLLFGPRYRPGTFTDNHFLNAIGAAESYHRATGQNDILPPEEHQARLEAIYATGPEEHRVWLEGRLAFSNAPTLRDRLYALHARVAGIVSGVIGSAEAYAGPVVATRNALTHRGDRGRKTKPIPGRALYRMTEQTVFLLTACLLQDLGFDDVEIVTATRRTRRFRTLTELFPLTS